MKNTASDLSRLSFEFGQDFGFPLPVVLPNYQAGSSGRWALRRRPRGVTNNYVATTSVEEDHMILTELSSSGAVETWMAVSQFELESHAWHLRQSVGSVLTAGLGMGVFAFAVAAKPEVERVLVIEKEASLVSFIRDHTNVFSAPFSSKIEIVIADATDLSVYDRLRGAAGRPFDYIYTDIWKECPDPTAIDLMSSIHSLKLAKNIGWWGQELDLVAWFSTNSIGCPDCASFERYFKETGLTYDFDEHYIAFTSSIYNSLYAEDAFYAQTSP